MMVSKQTVLSVGGYHLSNDDGRLLLFKSFESNKPRKHQYIDKLYKQLIKYKLDKVVRNKMEDFPEEDWETLFMLLHEGKIQKLF